MKNKGTIITVGVAIILVIVLVVFAQTDVKNDQSNSINTTEETMNNEETNTTTTTEGLTITVLQEGAGNPSVKGDSVTVNYTGMLEDETVFDSNVKEEFGHVEPFTFVLGQNLVIQGWEQGVLGMKQGEKRRLVIPAALGYGDRGAGALIPPGATLVFEVELLEIN